MKMNANEVVESYVTDVALQLPRKQRNDVAFELRALINEGLQDKADESGRAVDAEMATEFLNAFGPPETVAARYRPALNIIDPADGHKFLRATFIGLAIVWSLGLLELLQTAPDVGLLNALGKWWVGTVIGSLWWPGVLVTGFGLTAWVRRRWPQSSGWKPRAGDRIHGGRLSIMMGLVGMLIGMYLLANPRWILDFFWNGHAAPVAYKALTYTDTFLARQAPVLFGLIALNIPLYVAVMVKGRWTLLLRWLETGLVLLTSAAMAWTVMDGPIFMTTNSDQAAKFFMVLIIAFTLIVLATQMYRSVRPNPDQQVHATR